MTKEQAETVLWEGPDLAAGRWKILSQWLPSYGCRCRGCSLVTDQNTMQVQHRRWLNVDFGLHFVRCAETLGLVKKEGECWGWPKSPLLLWGRSSSTTFVARQCHHPPRGCRLPVTEKAAGAGVDADVQGIICHLGHGPIGICFGGGLSFQESGRVR